VDTPRLQRILDSISDAVLIVQGGSLDIVDANQAALDVTGFSRSQLCRLTLLDLIPTPRQGYMADLLQACQSGQTRRSQHPLLVKSEAVIPVESTLSAADIDGQTQFMVTVRTLDQAPSLRTALAPLDDVFRAVFDEAPLGIFVFDPAGKVSYFNRAQACMNGVDFEHADDLIGISALDENAIIRRNGLLEPLRGVLQGKPFIREIPRFHLRTGDTISVSVHGIPLTNANQRVVGGLVLVDNITGRVRAESQLSESEARYRALTAAIPDVLLRVDRAANVIDYKPSHLVSVLAAEPEIGQPIASVLPPDLYKRARVAAARVRRTRKMETLEYRTVQPDDARDFEIRLIASGSDEILVMVRDITEQKAAIERLNTKEAMLQGVTQATIQLLVNNDLESAITEALAILGQVTHTRRAFVYEFHRYPAGNELLASLRYEWDSDPSANLIADPRLQNIPWLEIGTQEQYRLLLQGEPLEVPTDQMMVASQNYPGKSGANTLLIMPVFGGNQLWGYVGLLDYEPKRTWTSDEVSVLRTMAAGIGAAIHRQQTEIKLREERQFADTIREVGAILSSTLDRDNVLHRLLQQVKRVIPYDAANVMLVKDGTVHVAINTGYERYGASADEVNRVQFDIAETPLLKRMIEEQMPVFFSDVNQYPDWRIFPVSAWIGSWLGAPIIVQGEVLGILSLDSAQRGFYGPEHLELIMPFSLQAAIALQNAELYEKAQRQAAELAVSLEQLDALYAAGQSILSTLQLDEVLTRLAIQMTHLTNATSTIICEFDSGSRTCTVQSAYRRDDVPSQEHLRDVGDCIILDSPLLQQVTERRESVMLTGEEFRNGLPDNPCTEHIQEAFIVPMSNKDRVVGVAIIRESRPYHLHSADELWMCEALANQAAIALEQATLFNNIRELELIKSAIIRLASHDLRGPLTRVKGFVDLLQRQLSSTITDSQRDYFTLIDNATREMDRIVNDILSLQRIEAQHKRATPVVWSELIENAVQTLAVDVENKGLVLSVECDANLPEIPGDPVQLSHAIVNLIGNAIKYTPAGGQITVRGYTQERHGAHAVRVEVTDTGIGIQGDQQAALFESFSRGERAENAQIPGLGLGLSVVKAAAEYHHGKAYARGETGQGSTFGFWVPVP